MSGCPNTTEGGCRCPEHHPGLGAYSSDPDAYDAAIARLRKQGVRLRLVTMPAGAPGCTGTMTCPCERCVKDRVSRPALGAGPAQLTVRPSRRAA